MSKQKSADTNYLGVDDPKQTRMRAFPVPVSMFGAKKRCFYAAWHHRWDCLKYSVKFDAAFCFTYFNFESKLEETFEECVVKSTFTTDYYRNWKDVTKMNKGFSKHAASKEYLACYSTWKEKMKRSEMVFYCFIASLLH